MTSQNGINHLVGMTCTLTDQVVEGIGEEFKGTVRIVAAVSTETRGTAINVVNKDGKPSPCLGLEACAKLHKANQ
jgi:hypothetical protein